VPGFGPAAEILLFWPKDPKQLTPRPGSFDGADATYGMAGQLTALAQGPPVIKASAPGAGRQASGNVKKEEFEEFGEFQSYGSMCRVSIIKTRKM